MNNSAVNYRSELNLFCKKLLLLGFIDGIIVTAGTILINDVIATPLDGFVLSLYLMIPCIIVTLAIGTIAFTILYALGFFLKRSIISEGVIGRYTFLCIFFIVVFNYLINKFIPFYTFYSSYPFADTYMKMALLMWGAAVILALFAYLIGWMAAKAYLYFYKNFFQMKKPLILTSALLIVYLLSWISPVMYNKSKHFVALAPKQEVKVKNYADGNKVFLIGVDGATWDIIDPMIKKGELKNFKRLIDSGVRGNMQTFLPTDSPILWTSISTGKKPEKHGIKSFILVSFAGVSQPLQDFMQRGMFDKLRYMSFTKLSFEYPINTFRRRTSAIWNILSRYGKKVIIVNWFPSYPVEQVNGYMVSDKLLRALKYEREGTAPYEYSKYLAYPESLCMEIDKNLGEYYSPGFAKKTFDTDFDEYIYESENIYFNIADELLEKAPDTNFFTVYFRGTDDLEHIYWKYIDAEKYPWVTPEERQKYGNEIYDYYRQVDNYIGSILDKADANTTVIVISDHGHEPIFKFFDNTPWGAHDTGPDGIFIAAGKNISGAFNIHKPALCDIAPTILYLLGLPAGADMDGRVLTEIIDRNLLSANPPASIPSYDMGDVSRAGTEKGSKEMMKDEGLMNKLKALGYIN